MTELNKLGRGQAASEASVQSDSERAPAVVAATHLEWNESSSPLLAAIRWKSKVRVV